MADAGDLVAPDPTPAVAHRREAERLLLRDGAVRGPRDLRRRLGTLGFEVDDDALRADLAAVGARRVDGPDGPRLGLAGPPSGDDADRSTPAALAAAVRADPDWSLQLVVVVVAAVFVLVGFLGWLVGGAGGAPPDPRQPAVTAPAP